MKRKILMYIFSILLLVFTFYKNPFDKINDEEFREFNSSNSEALAVGGFIAAENNENETGYGLGYWYDESGGVWDWGNSWNTYNKVMNFIFLHLSSINKKQDKGAYYTKNN